MAVYGHKIKLSPESPSSIITFVLFWYEAPTTICKKIVVGTISITPVLDYLNLSRGHCIRLLAFKVRPSRLAELRLFVHLAATSLYSSLATTPPRCRGFEYSAPQLIEKRCTMLETSFLLSGGVATAPLARELQESKNDVSNYVMPGTLRYPQRMSLYVKYKASNARENATIARIVSSGT